MPVYSILTSSVSFTRRICSLRSWRSLKVDCAVMEYTRAKPWPFFMYKSLIAVNCSYTRGKKDGEAMSADIQLPTFTYRFFFLYSFVRCTSLTITLHICEKITNFTGWLSLNNH